METFEPLREVVQEIEKKKLVKKVIVESDICVANLNPDTKPQTKYRKRLRHSTWGILWNTNQKFINQDDPVCLETAHNLKALLDKFKGSIGTFVQFKGKEKEEHSWTPKYIKGCKVDGEVELGDKQYQVHAHVLLTILHWSCIQLDYEGVKKLVKNKFPGAFVSFTQLQTPIAFEKYSVFPPISRKRRRFNLYLRLIEVEAYTSGLLNIIYSLLNT